MTSLAYDLARSAYHRIKRVIGTMKGLNHNLAPEVRIEKRRFGTFYGGWVLSPSAFRGRSPLVYSFGLGEDISFDLAMITEFDAAVHGFDPTPTQSDWAHRKDLPTKFHFHEIGLAGRDGTAKFGPPTNLQRDDFTTLRGHVEGAVEFPVARLETLINRLGHTHIDLLKMDIEGAEYEALDDILRSSIRPTQLLIEFHYFGMTDGLKYVRAAVGDLQKAGYKIFDVAPLGREISFIHESALK